MIRWFGIGALLLLAGTLAGVGCSKKEQPRPPAAQTTAPPGVPAKPHAIKPPGI